MSLISEENLPVSETSEFIELFARRGLVLCDQKAHASGRNAPLDLTTIVTPE